jgi:hypothetical protein
MMDKTYRFTSDVEPTEEQLNNLMLAVLEDVKERAEKATAQFKQLQTQALQQLQATWQLKQQDNNGQ